MANERISVSFEYLRTNKKLADYKTINVNNAIFNNLHEACKLTHKEFTNNSSAMCGYLRIHRIKWDKSILKMDAFAKMEPQISGYKSYQMDFGGNWRARGILANTIFFIIWLDPLHGLCPRKK
ncbi:hypothetical protein BMS3Bbin04_01754 [bacterium BMS3Bbin04]|nr:hypothetical protein BMS3Bbin04_01754 [bacterium BMS3Bbin04]